MGYDAWKTYDSWLSNDELPVLEYDEDPGDEVEGDGDYYSPLFTDHWSELTDEEAEDRANAAMLGW